MDDLLEVTSVLSPSYEVTMGSPERTGNVSVLKLICWEVAVSSTFLGERVDSVASFIDSREPCPSVEIGL